MAEQNGHIASKVSCMAARPLPSLPRLLLLLLLLLPRGLLLLPSGAA